MLTVEQGCFIRADAGASQRGESISINSRGVSSGSGSNNGYAKRNPDKTFKMCPKAIDWGWSQFIASNRILREGYVDPMMDTLVV